MPLGCIRYKLFHVLIDDRFENWFLTQIFKFESRTECLKTYSLCFKIDRIRRLGNCDVCVNLGNSPEYSRH